MSDDKPVTLADMKSCQELQILASTDLLTRAQKGAIKRPPEWQAHQAAKIRVEQATLGVLDWLIAKKAERAGE